MDDYRNLLRLRWLENAPNTELGQSGLVLSRKKCEAVFMFSSGETSVEEQRVNSMQKSIILVTCEIRRPKRLDVFFC